MPARRTLLSSVLALWVVACTPATVNSPPGLEVIPPPAVSEVESVLFVVGDAGEARTATSPILERLRQDIEWWSGELARDSAVGVLLLGDNIYPLGLSPPGSETFDSDTAALMSQVRLVDGQNARAFSTRALFAAGNHDWGLQEDREGFVRLGAQQAFLNETRTRTGALVELAPEAGSGGPAVIDWGEHIRLLILDTAWWLLRGVPVEQQGVLVRIDQAFASAGDRSLLMAAHHPFRSGGPHGGGFSFWETFGLRYLMFRSGALLQDITSRPYRVLEDGLRFIFERYDPPLAFLAGHEHALQVIESVEPTDPQYNLVSGSASKLSSVSRLEGMLFAQSAPGYLRLVIDRDGGVRLYVEAAPAEFLTCASEEPERTTCMAEAVNAFRTVFSRRLRRRLHHRPLQA